MIPLLSIIPQPNAPIGRIAIDREVSICSLSIPYNFDIHVVFPCLELVKFNISVPIGVVVHLIPAIFDEFLILVLKDVYRWVHNFEKFDFYLG